MARRRRILFFAEAVTLAHVARPLVLAAAARQAGHETAIACDPRYERFVTGDGQDFLPIRSIPSERFLSALARGRPFYDLRTLRGYAEDDAALMRRLRPDLVVGDFRLSLSVSARRAGIPYATVVNAYWSPYAVDERLPMPVLPVTRALPLPAARLLFDALSPFVARQFCRPLDRLRTAYGLPALEAGLRTAYTDADHVLYADSPSMFPTRPLPAQHRRLGPILWAPPVPAPPWWDRIDDRRPVVYLTLGSSGPPALLAAVLQALSGLDVTVLVSTAGAGVEVRAGRHVHAADYLPGIEAARRSRLVICNGGSPTAHQALAAGVPVLGIASNMDQFLNMAAVVDAGAGLLLRADRAGAAAIRAAVQRLLSQQRFAEGAATLAGDLAALDAKEEFRRFVDDLGIRPAAPTGGTAAPVPAA